MWLQPLPAYGQSARTLTGEAVDGSKSPFRGSVIAYEHAATAISAFKGAEPRWNPYYAHQISLRPEFHWEDWPVYFRGRFNLSQELTLSDSTTYRHEVVWSDATLEAVAPGWVEPVTKIRIGGNLRLTVPLSKASWAQTLTLGISPALTVTRPFPVLKGLVVGYGVRYAGFLNRSTTTVFDGPRIPCGDPDSALCRRLSHSGSRNPVWSLSHGPVVVLMATEKLAFTATFNHYFTQLHALTPASVPALTGEVTLGDGNGIDGRFSAVAVLDATYALTDELSLAAGVLTSASQLGPDGTYRNPFVNRFTMLYVDVLVDVERLTARFRGRKG